MAVTDSTRIFFEYIIFKCISKRRMVV